MYVCVSPIVQHGRCTVGRINWTPNNINVDPSQMSTTSIVAQERRTALHELFHVLGFANPANGTRYRTCGCVCVLNSSLSLGC